MADELPEAGWYPHPALQHKEKYWDGKAWTDQVREKKRAKKPAEKMAKEKKPGFWAKLLAVDEDLVASGMVSSTVTMKIFKDGTFTLGAQPKDKLVGFNFDTDSMRRKSVTGRGAAALATGGLSLLAANNNRGVAYVTVTGERLGVKSYTTRNPMGTMLNGCHQLQAAAESILKNSHVQQVNVVQQTTPLGSQEPDLGAQLKQLADLHAAGALSAEEFASAKARLLS